MKIIACMSGTSLDGLDLALCEFDNSKTNYSYKILEFKTFEYSTEWKKRLGNSQNLSGLELCFLDKDFGSLTAQYILEFIKAKQISKVDYIASHGHTIFHQPEKNLSLQIGNAIQIASITQIPTINDFRSLDVSLGGQGAPLVPIGDHLLFSEYDYCVNLGGFSNISFEEKGKRLAFDIAPTNLALNYYSKKMGFDFDKNGELGKKGEINKKLLSKLNQIEYYKKSFPKSLGKEWLDSQFIPLIPSSMLYEDVLRTLYEHIGEQIGKILSKTNTKTLLSGGGAFNSFLVDRIQAYSNSNIFIPENNIINFKEALIFGFLGYLKINNKINVLSSVTGASRNSCSGVITYP